MKIKKTYKREINFELAIQEYDNLLDEPLKFIQLGCNDGVLADPIYKLIQKNKWTGLFVDANQFYLDKCAERYRSQYPELTAGAHWQWQQAGIITLKERRESESSLRDFYFIEPSLIPRGKKWMNGVGSFNYNHPREHVENKITKDENKIKKIIKTQPIKCLTINDIFNIFQYDRVDLLQTDLECWDVKIIKEIEDFKYQPKFIHFEACPHQSDNIFEGELNNNLNKMGYELYFDTLDRDWLAVNRQMQ